MSVVVREKGKLGATLFIKGADSVIAKRLSHQS